MTDTSWRPMSTAPRDGTYVELKCSYGVAPWYCIAKWTDESVSTDIITGEKKIYKNDRYSWQKPDGGGPFDEGSLQWRPYECTEGDYVDPTNGRQNDMKYWREALATKCGLPTNYFEKPPVVQEAKSGVSRSWWQRLFG